MTGRWLEEFDQSYEVPEPILEAAGVVDTSWHNNACPSFGDADGKVNIWVEHPDPAQRDMAGAHRFTVAADFDERVLYEGDDVAASLAAYREVAP